MNMMSDNDSENSEVESAYSADAADTENLFDDAGSDSGGTVGSLKEAREDIKLMNVVRAIVILILLTFAFISAEAVFVVVTLSEDDNYKDAYKEAANKLIEGFYEKVSTTLLVAKSFSTVLSSSADSSAWPYVSFKNFEEQSKGFRELSSASTIYYSPKVSVGQQESWEAYAEQTFHSLFNSTTSNASGSDATTGDDVVFHRTYRGVKDGIYHFENHQPVTSIPKTDGLNEALYPLWQTGPLLVTEDSSDPKAVLFDESSNPTRLKALTDMEARKGSVISDFLWNDAEGNDFASYLTPRSSIYYPIKSDRGDVAGTIVMEMRWEVFLQDALKEFKEPLYAVIESSCQGSSHTFKVEGAKVSYLGFGDLHDEDVEDHAEISSSFDTFASLFEDYGSASIDPKKNCVFRLMPHASAEFKSSYFGNKPEVFRAIVMAVFFLIVFVFVVYDSLIERRQGRVIDAAARSDAIVRSLFPDAVRDRLYENAKKREGASNKNKSLKDDGSTAFVPSQKNRLVNFIRQPAGVTNANAANTGVEPIADLFPATSIMFADIAGFTAWSSEREPSQVFILLETIYRAMDIAARKLGVFKVETVGDCYVAATGIPDPQPDHAQVMARFAHACNVHVSRLTRSLDARLGPGTSDLLMRFGLHTGPVTAGVLRGKKARFQLFGDTMNTAARMESTGIKGRIQVSAEFAALLTEEGYEHWIVPREELVHAKGKGELQTYWLKLSLESTHSDISGDSSESQANLMNPGIRGDVFGTSLEGIIGQTPIDAVLSRLIDWNVEVLYGQLKSVVAYRNAHGIGSAADDLHLHDGNADGKIALDEYQMVIGMLPLTDVEYQDKAGTLDPAVRKELKDFVTAIATGYRRNAFHNFEHASHVILSATKQLKRILSADDAANRVDGTTAEERHRHTFGIASDPLTQFAILFSALIHDVGHTGVPNFRLAVEEPELAQKYKNRSIAEQRSVDIAWELLALPRFKTLRSCIYQSKKEYTRFRHLVVNSLLATDIFEAELKKMRDSRWAAAFYESSNDNKDDKSNNDRKATIVIEHVIQASDVSHTMQHWHVYQKWNSRLFKELYTAYKANRLDKDPSVGWYQGEISFFDKYVIPLAHKLKECGVFGASTDEYLTYAQQNREEWIRKGESIVKQMVEEYEEGASRDATVRTSSSSMSTLPSKVRVQKGKVCQAENKKAAPLFPPPIEISENGMESDEQDTIGSPVTRVVRAPPGKLGLVLDTTIDGDVIVSEVMKDSPLKEEVECGDLILSLDGVELSDLPMADVTELLCSRDNETRVFTILSSNLKSL